DPVIWFPAVGCFPTTITAYKTRPCVNVSSPETILALFIMSFSSRESNPSGAKRAQSLVSTPFLIQLGIVFIAYYVAGKLGQATTNIRSSNLGPVWPAYGIALAAFLRYGYRVWPAVFASAFVIAQTSVPALAAAGQAMGATLAAA